MSPARRFCSLEMAWKRPSFALPAERIARAYPQAHRIHLVLDNLNTHTPASLIKAFGTERGRALASRFAFHQPPKHASWLNTAEIEASLVSRECLGRNRIPALAELRRRVRQWNAAADRARRKINWTFTVRDAERIFGSPPCSPPAPRPWRSPRGAPSVAEVPVGRGRCWGRCNPRTRAPRTPRRRASACQRHRRCGTKSEAGSSRSSPARAQ
ncbi:transposase [Sorangium sp. So ce233]|uniref:transposase n=1 Tax=Sorangium sp. So ce233 TaxID=3133290 RepID=UPI003F628D48